jgi:hypothetical protein
MTLCDTSFLAIHRFAVWHLQGWQQLFQLAPNWLKPFWQPQLLS